MLFPAIIVSAFERSHSLKRLLVSINNANYLSYQNISLIISIDKSFDTKTYEIANSFKWDYGEKVIISHSEKLGLKNHILFCGGLSHKYGSIILLEDDLVVAPDFYNYSVQSLNFFKNDSKIAGIALFHSNYNEITNSPFYPAYEGHSNYFHQIPCSWGQVWTSEQWEHFSTNFQNSHNQAVPKKVSTWPEESSWKKTFFRYMMAYDKYFVYPHYSLSTNYGDKGQHYKTKTSQFLVPLSFGRNIKYSFIEFNISNSIYDAWGEILPQILKKNNPDLLSFDFTCDLFGNKELKEISNEYLISVRDCSQPVYGFDHSLIPPEINISNSLKGSFFYLGKKSSFNDIIDWGKKEHLIEHLTKVYISDIRKSIDYKYNSSSAYKIGKLLLKPFYYLKKTISRLPHQIVKGSAKK